MNIPLPGSLLPGPSGPDTLRLDQGLGGGAFGVVFAATDLKNGSRFAVKFPQFVFFGGQPEVAAFLNEVEVAKTIRHPNVVDVLFVQQPAGPSPPFLVMPYLTEGTLKDQLEAARSGGSKIDLPVLKAWTLGLIAGMEAINAHFLHRDLKPDNILMDKGVPRISDFGLAKMIGAATRSLTFKGHQHLLYMAPEGWRGEQNTIQLDMYALGLVLYEISSLRYPYTLPTIVSNTDSFRRMHFFERAPALESLRGDLPHAFCQVVTRLMEKRPEGRFQNWADVREHCTRAFETKMVGHASQSLSVQSLLRAVSGAHDVRTARDLASEQREARQKEAQELDRFQADKLRDEVQLAATDFNSASALGRIEIQNHVDSQGIECRLPEGETLRLKFFWIEPPMTLKKGIVRFAAVLQGRSGRGINFLLCRRNEGDMYGTWVSCRARVSAIVDPRRVPPRPEPFGFDEREIREIQKADGAIHIFTIEYPTVSASDAFLALAQEETQPRRLL